MNGSKQPTCAVRARKKHENHTNIVYCGGGQRCGLALASGYRLRWRGSFLEGGVD
jgi:predicted sulfurtransferase